MYYSIENNTLGEAALYAVDDLGEENIPGTFLTEPRKRGNSVKVRRGFTTTHKTKIAACSKLKHWIETEKLQVASKNLLHELKTFIARGNTYAAKDGETDDLVMSLVLITRMAQEITKYEPTAFDYLDASDDDDYDEPMPMSFL
jgi:hypothetical protein